MSIQLFEPAYGYGQTVAPGAATARVALGISCRSVVLTNVGTEMCYIRAGDATVNAAATDYPVLPNSQVTVTVQKEDTHIAHISGTGSVGSLHVLPGQGF